MCGFRILYIHKTYVCLFINEGSFLVSSWKWQVYFCAVFSRQQTEHHKLFKPLIGNILVFVYTNWTFARTIIHSMYAFYRATALLFAYKVKSVLNSEIKSARIRKKKLIIILNDKSPYKL